MIRALAWPDDCDLALRVAEAAARLAGAATVEADYYGAIELGELRRCTPPTGCASKRSPGRASWRR